MDPIRISCVKQRIIFEYIEVIIRALFSRCPEPSDAALPSNDSLKTDFLDLCNDYKQCIHLLNYKGKSYIRHTRAHPRELLTLSFTRLFVSTATFDEPRIRHTQLKLDRFCTKYTKLFGGQKITNYLHIWWGGHLRTFLRTYGNLYIYASQSSAFTN